MKRLFYIFAAVPVLFSCSEQDGLIVPSELGVRETSITIPCTAGTFDLNILADGAFTLTLDDASWLSLDSGLRSMNASGDCKVQVSYQMNRSIKREAVISLERGGKLIEVPVSQEGVLVTGIEFDRRSLTIDSAAGTHSVKVVTLLPDSDLDFSVEYTGTGGWITDFKKVNNFLVFSVIENVDETLRTANITLSGKSRPDIRDILQVGQLPAGGALVPVGFDKLGDIANGTLSGEGLCLEGVVINDNSQGNGAPNANISPSVQDNTLSSRTAYLQSKDGSAGVMIVFNTVEDNITRRYDSVTFLLDGTTVTAYDNPLRYVVTGATAGNLAATKAGSSFDVVKKEKRMSELTDADIYTFVTLKDCEIPIRKGPFVPIDLRLKTIINKYPMVIRDIDGGTMHLVTNLTASWQRDGKGIPEGSGSISGVLVHETCDNFEWDAVRAAEIQASGLMEDYITEIGEIGRYQIRPVTREEIALAESLEDGFSRILMEIRFFNAKYDDLVINVKDKKVYSTYPSVEYPYSDPAVKGYLEVQGGTKPGESLDNYRDWTLLGPLVDGLIKDPSLGNGVYDYFGRSAQRTVSSYASTGQLVETAGSAWRDINWSPDKNWKATFSTEGLTEDNLPLSVQLGVCGGLGELVGGPRYWVAQYSVNGTDWEDIGNYTVPDFPIRSSRKAWQCPGYKNISFTLPEDPELVGKKSVFIRMHPVDKRAGTSTTYDGGSIVASLKSQLNYFAVRCNK
ncbi:MAG: BACON domain-containing protein [Bacteroidales bacterium]|nr:BACON domain-containing protein [Bacteroidales bacterium]